jgi:hypothetical protein
MRAFAFLALLAVGCGGSESETSADDAGDGRYRPAPSGEHVTEKVACEALANAQEGRRAALAGCTITQPLCPSPLRTEFSTQCMEYDGGSVDGCIAYYGEHSATCDDLKTAIDFCVITPYPGTEPAGCP